MWERTRSRPTTPLCLRNTVALLRKRACSSLVTLKNNSHSITQSSQNIGPNYKTKCEELNVFSNVGQTTICENSERPNHMQIFFESEFQTIFPASTDANEVTRVIRKMKISCQSYDIPTKLLKLANTVVTDEM